MNLYCTLDEIKREIGGAGMPTATANADDALLVREMQAASRVIDRLCRRDPLAFMPVITTRYYDTPETNELFIDSALLSLTTLTNGDGNAIAASDYFTYPRNTTPIQWIELNRGGTAAWYYSTTSNSRQQAIAVNGIWGYHDAWADAWASVDAVADAVSISASVTTVTVADADGVDENNITPRFQVGQLIRMGSEYCHVTGVTYGTTNTLKVKRGMNGSTAATHLNGVAVEVYRPIEAIARAANRLAVWLYRAKGTSSDVDRLIVTADGTKVLPMKIPADVYEYLIPYIRLP